MPQAPARDGYLDCLKGFAILTVVAGHTFQGATPDFDAYWPFRFVYAFHMPMFMFVAGMTAALFFERQIRAQAHTLVFLRDLLKKAQRLLIPFLSWAVVGYWLNPSGHFIAYMTKAIEFPENGLWFLPALFQCSIGLAAAGLLVIAFRRTCLQRWPISWDERRTMVATLIVATILVNYASRCIPNGLGLNLARQHFAYLAAGLIYQIVLSRGLPAMLRPLPYAVFLALVPFWHRTDVSSLVAHLPPSWGRPRTINGMYVTIVAFAGTLAFVDLSRMIYQRLPAFLERSFALLGRRSLDVYAIHFHLLGTWPPMIAPTLYSLAISTLLRLNSWTALVFFGQRQSLLATRPGLPDHPSAVCLQARDGSAVP